jgi:hypothetical protein
MGWYIRRYIKVGPVRFNLSKSGIGTSVGVRGFRVGVRPNGRTYVHAGRYGLYYRQELGRGRSNKIQRDVAETNQLCEVQEYNTASSQELIPESRKEFLQKLNKAYKGTRLDYLCFGLFVFLTLICFMENIALGAIASIIGITITFLVVRWEFRRRVIVIHYDLDNTYNI